MSAPTPEQLRLVDDHVMAREMAGGLAGPRKQLTMALRAVLAAAEKATPPTEVKEALMAYRAATAIDMGDYREVTRRTASEHALADAVSRWLEGA